MHPRSTRLQIIDAIQTLKNDYKGMKSGEFSTLIGNACTPEFRNSQGRPTAFWSKVAESYLAQMRRLEAFIDPNTPYC